MPVRTNSEGLLEILHPETGAYVPASTLLQVEGGLLTALVPNQLTLLADIQEASGYLRLIEAALLDVRAEIFAVDDKLAQSNISLSTLGQIDAALGAVKSAIDSLETLGTVTNTLLTAVNAEIVTLSGKMPATLGAKMRDASLSVALATDSTIFASLTSILNSLSDINNNSVVSLLLALSAKIPASLGAKLRTASLSVALATDSTLFASLTNILNALSDGGVNSALSYLSTVAGSQHWKTPAKFNGTSPIINAATAAASSAAYALNSQAEALSLQNFFSATGLSAQFAVELRVTTGSTSLHDRTYYYRGDVASPYAASAGVFPGESPIIIPTYGYVQAVVHLHTITGGNVSTYAREIK
jgi:hypothetical protein